MRILVLICIIILSNSHIFTAEFSCCIQNRFFKICYSYLRPIMHRFKCLYSLLTNYYFFEIDSALFEKCKKTKIFSYLDDILDSIFVNCWYWSREWSSHKCDLKFGINKKINQLQSELKRDNENTNNITYYLFCFLAYIFLFNFRVVHCTARLNVCGMYFFLCVS